MELQKADLEAIGMSIIMSEGLQDYGYDVRLGEQDFFLEFEEGSSMHVEYDSDETHTECMAVTDARYAILWGDADKHQGQLDGSESYAMVAKIAGKKFDTVISNIDARWL